MGPHRIAGESTPSVIPARLLLPGSRHRRLASQDAQTVRGACLVMELTGWFVIVPLSLASLVHRACLVTGLQVGSVPALLGRGETLDQPLYHVSPAALHADARLLRRHRRRHDVVRWRSPRVAEPIPPVLHTLLLVAAVLGVHKPAPPTPQKD